MKLDTFTFNRPGFYKKKARTLYQIKRAIYAAGRKDLAGDWRLFLEGRAGLLETYCRGRTILDVGCGTGDFLHELATDFQAGDLHGVDISEAMIGAAKDSFPDYKFMVAGGDRLPYESDAIDVVAFQWVFHHLSVETAQAAIAEAKRVARETIIVQDTIGYDSAVMSRLAPVYWMLADGGVCYRTGPQWREFFERNNLTIDKSHNGEIIRTGIFALKPAN